MAHRLKAVLALALSALLAGCGAGGEATSLPEAECRPLYVVASTSILGDVLTSLVGEQGVVEVLMSRGVDPHAFQVSARQATAHLHVVTAAGR